MTRPWIELRSPTSLANTIPTKTIHIYIVIHRDTISLYHKLFNVTRPMICFKPRAKLNKFYISWISYPRAIVTSVSVKEIFRYTIFSHIRYRQPECSIHEKSYCISVYVAVSKFLTRLLSPRSGENTHTHTHTRTHARAHTHTHTHTHIYIYIYIYIDDSLTNTILYIYILDFFINCNKYNIYIYIYIYIYIGFVSESFVRNFISKRVVRARLLAHC